MVELLFHLKREYPNAGSEAAFLREQPKGEAMLNAPPETQLAALTYALNQVIKGEGSTASGTFVAALLSRKLPWAGEHATLVLTALKQSLQGMRFVTPWAKVLLKSLKPITAKAGVPPKARLLLKEIARELENDRDRERRKIGALLRVMAADDSEGPVVPLVPDDAWAQVALNELASLPSAQRQTWADLLNHCTMATAGSPTARWIKTARDHVTRIGEAHCRSKLSDWMERFPEPRQTASPGGTPLSLNPHNVTILKGLLWLASGMEDPELARGLGQAALTASRKIPGVGPRAASVANAAVWALGQMPGEIALGQLAMLKIKMKGAAAQKGIEKALTAAAERWQIPREEIEEMAVPAYGLDAVGQMEERFGEFSARLTVDFRGKSELVWLRADSGKAQKSIPAAVKTDFPEELQELKGAAKDIERMVPAQRDRIDNLFLDRKRWPVPIWRERYLDHPVVGLIARRLIWKFVRGKESVDGIWHDGSIVDVDGVPVGDVDEPDLTVEPWHPVGRPLDDIRAWRDWIERHEVRQPFKQAHRELYLLTDAERRTNTYSNRYAAHVLRQHQFHALCGVRGWRNALRLLVDNSYAPPTKFLPQWGLRAEFWVEGLGNAWGTDTTDNGSFLYLSTDQVRFYRINADPHYAHAGGGGYTTQGGRTPENEPLPLDLIPPLVLSEILRDVDLFVGVSSVGNDPTWADGGPDGRFVDYWTGYSFGDLTASAKTRKEVLERLIPRLKIASRCSFDEKFLKVRGDLRTYKIHLGSGNILMEPNDQYLCIVPDSRMEKGSDGMFLPFEGDRTLSIILSKAMLLAADTKITDTTITRQIEA